MQGKNWCGVCLKDAEPYSYGWCPYDSNPPREKSTITRVRRAKHWGFCSHLCEKKSEASSLQETKLDVLTPQDCARFNTTMLSYREEGELCAGNKLAYPKMDVFVRYRLRKPKNGSRYVFIKKDTKKNTVCCLKTAES